ncbi:P-loop containing nucleoside triphosphate hydrolase protein [Irpex rosettiformis]|uniref:P-loop containing nucleoside triphosphate hydrolase protein n=1 Tax=Irpex rosettiformis TaxID=378272 RepID=A0ACB8TYI2_9APHY|nr:P-loop containing nucleoside triphosphate hydrolase protein [Irpex rosettiformis]
MASSAALTTTHLPRLRQELEEWRAKQPSSQPFSKPLETIQTRLDEHKYKTERGKDVIVAFRTRPPLEHEAEQKFNISTEGSKNAQGVADLVDDGESKQELEFCSGVSVTSADPGVFVAHVPGMKWSGPTLTHKKFDSDIAFGPNVPNDEVYERTVVASDIIPLALANGTACILAYGQTGTGKTYTMEALEYRIARDLFVAAKKIGDDLLEAERKAAPDVPAGGGDDSDETTIKEGGVFEFSVTFLELLGKRVVDLLEPIEGLPLDEQGNPIRKEVPVSEDKNGDVRPRVNSRTIESAEHLRELVSSALSYRRVEATTRNATSSRSHALLHIRIKNKLLPFAQDGQLILVDLAGSERYEDSKAHDKKRMLESRENNNSLMHLKECVRAKAKMAQEDGFVHIPWRANKLTMLLKPVFDVESRQPSKTLIIAHVSPHIQDSAHSVSTLSYASPFKTSPPKPRGPPPYNAADPRTWDHIRTTEWLTTQFTKAAKARRAHAYKLKAQDAAKKGKKLPSLDDDAPVELAVDVEKLCPPGMTARNFGGMYSIEFVQRCLEAKNPNAGKEVTTSVVKNIGGDVIAELTYAILVAKTKSRREIMKSRKVVNADETYGDSPWNTVPGTDIPKPEVGTPDYELFIRYTPDQYLIAAQRQRALWDDRITQALIKNHGSQAQKDKNTVKFETVMELMDEFYEKVYGPGGANTSEQ